MKVSKNVLVHLLLIGLTAVPLGVGAANSSIKLVDLAALSDQQLLSLKDSEFEVLRSEIAYERARADYAAYKGLIKEAKQREKVADLNHDAAKIERKAAKAEGKFAASEEKAPELGGVRDRLREDSPVRRETSLGRYEVTELELEQADIYVNWREQERDAANLNVDVTRIAMDVAATSRDIARVEALRNAGAPTAAGYNDGKLRKNLGKQQTKLSKLQQKHQQKMAKADELKARYESIAGKLAVNDGN